MCFQACCCVCVGGGGGGGGGEEGGICNVLARPAMDELPANLCLYVCTYVHMNVCMNV